jgi:hypothetical protein
MGTNQMEDRTSTSLVQRSRVGLAEYVEAHINRPPVSVASKSADNHACSPPRDKSHLPWLSSTTRAPDLAPEHTH